MHTCGSQQLFNTIHKGHIKKTVHTRCAQRREVHYMYSQKRRDEKRQRLIQICSWMCRPSLGALKPDVNVQLDGLQERGLRDVVAAEVAMECHPSAARHGLFVDALNHVSRLDVILPSSTTSASMARWVPWMRMH